MFRLSVNELSTIKWNLEESIINYGQNGYDCIGLSYPRLIEYGEEKGRELLAEHQFSISSINCVGEFTGWKGKTFRQGVIESLDVIQTASDMGAKTVVMSLGSRNGHTRNHALRILRTAFNVLAEACQAVGVQLAIEPVHTGAFHDSYVNTISQCLDLISQVDNPNLGIALDCYHLGHNPDIVECVELCAPLIKLVQLADAKHAPMGQQNRCMLGHGRLPLVQILQTLRECSYDGYYEIELLGKEVAQVEYNQLLSESKATAQLWQDILIAYDRAEVEINSHDDMESEVNPSESNRWRFQTEVSAQVPTNVSRPGSSPTAGSSSNRTSNSLRPLQDN